ncbi:CRAL-TRIO domain containing protein, partial [Oryctes borbonicus]
DDHIIENFVRHCKCDLEKAKKKFENFLLSRISLKIYYKDREITDAYFDDIKLHRYAAVWPKLTPDGYRIGISKLQEDVATFDMVRLFHFVLVILDLLVGEDTCAAYIGIVDLKNLSVQHIGKINFKILAAGLNLIYNVAPLRYNAMHFLNVPHIPEPIIALIKKLVPAKIISRVTSYSPKTTNWTKS